MHRPNRLMALVLSAVSLVLVGAAKPPPAPFTPALSYKYGTQEIRLANADGSQAVLLVRWPLLPVLHHAIAPLTPLGQGQVAFVEGSAGLPQTLRVVSWTQSPLGGSLDITLDPGPLLTVSDGEIRSLDYSPDGTRLAVVSRDFSQSTSVLRFFDVATRMRIGVPFTLAQHATMLRWRSSDGSVLMRGVGGTYSFKDGAENFLFASNQTGDFDTFNGGSPFVIFGNGGNGPGGLIQLWDGTLPGGLPVLTTITDGISPSLSCDNSRMIIIRLSPRRAVYNYILATGVAQEFSRDRSITYPSYPNCILP